MTIFSHKALFRTAAVALALAAAPLVLAHDFKSGEITIDHPIARVNIGDRPSAAYMTIKNAGAESDRLIAASSPAFGRVEIHNHVMEEGVMKMTAIDAIEAPAGGEATLEPGGLHLMLFAPNDSLGDGALIPITLEFEKAGSVEITALGEKIGSKKKDDPHAGHGSGHSGHSTTN